MQLFFVLILALIINQYLQNSVTKTDNKTPENQSTKNLFAFICLLLVLPALWFTYTTYNSLVAQKDINSDVLLANPVKSFEEVDNELPSIPNLNAFCFPVDAIRARYLMKEKKYDDALALINKAEAVNPYLPYGEFLKAQIFLEVNKMDSARRYAVAAFAKRPRSLANLQILNFISYKAKDTATLNRNFEIFTSYRKDQPAAWNDYLKYLHELPHDQNKFQALVDSALKLFPDDPELRQKKSGLFVNSNSPAVQAAAPYVIKALEAFNRKDYAVAIHNFAKAGELNPTDYTNWENIGVCYYVQNNFSVATGYFEKAIGLRTAVDGKSEFFNGICLINLGKKPEGCHYLQLADAKNYPGAKAQQAAFCQ